MKIGILGTGMVGRAIGEKLMESNHDVMFGTRDVAKTLERTDVSPMGTLPFGKWMKQHPTAKLETFREAAAHGDIVINATYGVTSLAALEYAGKENLKDKILIDVANPLDFSEGFPPSLTVCNTDSLGEQIQREFPETKVVKTLNTMNCYVMANPKLVPGNHTVFICGNDTHSKTKVKGFLTDWFGWKKENILDLGDITNARGTEMLLPIWVRLFGLLQNPMFNFHVAVGPKPQR
jgi:predicted dinucleotide-binding enzyme